MDEETEFLLRRASQEARSAIGADHPDAAEAHQEMSHLYSAKAVALLHREDGSTGRRGAAKEG